MLTDESKVFIRSGLSARDPRGVEWCDLDMTQLGKVIHAIFSNIYLDFKIFSGIMHHFKGQMIN